MRPQVCQQSEVRLPCQAAAMLHTYSKGLSALPLVHDACIRLVSNDNSSCMQLYARAPYEMRFEARTIAHLPNTEPDVRALGDLYAGYHSVARSHPLLEKVAVPQPQHLLCDCGGDRTLGQHLHSLSSHFISRCLVRVDKQSHTEHAST
jgi:hypothetical protein